MSEQESRYDWFLGKLVDPGEQADDTRQKAADRLEAMATSLRDHAESLINDAEELEAEAEELRWIRRPVREGGIADMLEPRSTPFLSSFGGKVTFGDYTIPDAVPNGVLGVHIDGGIVIRGEDGTPKIKED